MNMPLYDTCACLYMICVYGFIYHMDMTSWNILYIKEKELEGHVAINEEECLPGFSIAITEHYSPGGLRRKDSSNTEIYV